MTKLQVGLLFGRCSGEHEVFINSARVIYQALVSGTNQGKYQVTPFYIQKNGVWANLEQFQTVLDKGKPLPVIKAEKTQFW